MKHIKREKMGKRLKKGLISLNVLLLSTVNAFAAPPNNYTSIDKFMEFFAGFVWKLGGILAFVGVIEFIIAFRNDDPSKKSRAIIEISAGAMLITAGVGYQFFMT